MAALALSLAQTKLYSATSSLLFRDPGFSEELFGATVTPSSTGSSDREAATNLTLVKLPAVDDLTAQRLGRGFAGSEIRSKISISAESKSNVVSITATDSNPELAKQLANAFATTYIAFRRRADRQKIANARHLVDARVASLGPAAKDSPIGESLANQASRMQTLQSLQTGNAELVQTADLPGSPSSPKPVRNTVAAALIGLLLGIAMAVLLEKLDRRLRHPDEFEEAFEMPVLTAVPESKAFDVASRPPGQNGVVTLPESQAFQMLRARLRYFNVDRDVKVVLVTSAAPSDGKSTAAWEIAATAAIAGERALLIEAEFHRPTVALRHGAKPTPGLSELLTHQTPLEEVRQQISVTDRPDRVGSLDVITAGAKPPNPNELLESQQMRQLLQSVREDYDLVVIDTPPVLVVPDAIPLTKMVDGVIVLGCLDKTTRDESRRIREQLRKLGAPTLGVVANRTRRRGRGSSAYGYYDYSESYGSDPAAVSSDN